MQDTNEYIEDAFLELKEKIKNTMELVDLIIQDWESASRVQKI